MAQDADHLKLPFMPFYGRDFFGDERVRMMDTREIGQYVTLLWLQWEHGSLPKRPEDLTALLREEVSGRVLSCFPPNGEDRRVNPKLEKVYTAQMKVYKAKRRAGKLGARKRWHGS